MPTDSALTSAAEPRRVTCPTCGGPSLFIPANRFRPFCSERCKQIDLGAWAAEDFRVPDTGGSADSGQDPGAPQDS